MVVTVKSNVAKGDIVNKSNLKLVESRTSKISNDIITDIEAAATLEAMRNLRPGMVLRYTYLRERPMVRKSKPAKAKFNKPGITLEQDVLVLQDGNKGDIVKVKNMKSNQIFTAEVTAENTLTVK
jgi:flagella basal body P-ring formation protein FlgA